MPHHPGSSGKIEDTVTRMNITVEYVFLFVLYKGPCRGMHDAFWRASSARRVENIERI